MSGRIGVQRSFRRMRLYVSRRVRETRDGKQRYVGTSSPMRKREMEQDGRVEYQNQGDKREKTHHQQKHIYY